KALALRQLTTTPYAPLRVADWTSAGLFGELGTQFSLGSATVTSKLAAPDDSVYVADDRLTTDAARLLADRGVKSLVLQDAGIAPIDERLFNRTLTQPFAIDGVDG